MKNTSKKIIAAALAAATIFGSGMATGSAGLAKISPLAITASAEEGEKIVKDGITYTYSNGRIISASGKFSSSYTVPAKLNGKAVTEIGACAYENADIKTLTIPENVEYIDTGAFYNCGLETVNFNAVNCTVKDGNVDASNSYFCPAFFKNSSLTKVVFGDSVKTVPANVFAGAKALETVEFKTTVTAIGANAFYGCSSLKNIDMSNFVEIGASAFYGCTSFKNINLPKAVAIGEYAFSNCSNVTSVSFPKANTIDACAFMNTNIKTLTIPENVEYIDTGAFYNCGVKTVYFNAVNCTVKDGNVDASNAYFCPAFFKNSSLTKVVFGDKVKAVPANVFVCVKALETVEFKTTVTTIGSNAFYGCSSITDVYFPGSENEWKKVDIKENNDYLINARIHFNEEPQTENKVVSVSIGDNAALNYKDTVKLNPEIKTTGNPKYTVKFESSNAKVVSVDNNGNVKANGTGSAVITCTVTDANENTVKDTCNINVSLTWWQWIIKIVLFGFLWY